MIVSFTNKSEKFEDYLSQLKTIDTHRFDTKKLTEKTTEIELETESSLDEIANLTLFQYQIFPKQILMALSEWECEKRNIQLNDTIVQQAMLPPLPFLSVKLIFGVRVAEIIREENRVGFAYTTLEGHPEKGISSFTIEEQQGVKKFVIHTFSEPGNFWSKLVAFWFTNPYQNYCTRKAMKQVIQQIEIRI